MTEREQPTTGFNPNRLSFDDCLARVNDALARANMNLEGKIVTSRDPGMEGLTEALRIDNVPEGFSKWQLPISMRCATHMFFTVVAPGAKTPIHSHDEGPGMRFITGGSIIYEGKELFPGDWMFVPAGAQYTIQGGERIGGHICGSY